MIEKKEGFFSNLFKGKKNEDIENEREVLQNMLDKKERIISQLHEKLHLEEERRKKAEAFSKQADIIQKNLESRDKKNKELSLTVDNLKLSEGKLKVLIDALEDKLEDATKEKNTALEKYDNLLKNYNKTNEENTILKETHRSLKEEIGSLNALKDKGEQMQIVGDVFLSKDCLEEMQEEITSLKNICGEHRKTIDEYHDEAHLKDSIILDLKERLKASLTMEEKNIHYRLPVELLFTSSKFDEILGVLNSRGILFTDQLDGESFSEMTRGCKNTESAQRLLKDYHEGRYTWDIKTFISKGPKLSKIFARQRKLLGYFNDNYMEFLLDLENFDFSILSGFGFSTGQIEGFEAKIREYGDLRI